MRHSPNSSEQPEASLVRDSNLAPAQAADGAPAAADDLPNPEPMTFFLLGKFFAAPLLIISTIVGGAVLIVLLFGAPPSPQQRSVGELLQVLEASSGKYGTGHTIVKVCLYYRGVTIPWGS